jgi:hypothetical protein
MAIVFEKLPFNIAGFIPANDDFIIVFRDDALTPDISTVELDNIKLSFVPFPNPVNPSQLLFYVNLKSLFKAFIGNSQTIEDIQLNLGSNDYNQGFIEEQLIIEVKENSSVNSSTFDLTIFDAYTNFDDTENKKKLTEGETDENGITTQITEAVLQNTEITYFKGYPFELPIMNLLGTGYDVSLINNNSGKKFSTNSIINFNRILLSNGLAQVVEGQTYEGFANGMLNEDKGFVLNKFCYTFPEQNGLLNTGANNFTLTINDTTIPLKLNLKDQCGIYLKWQNDYGSFGNWLFDRVYLNEHEVTTLDTYAVNKYSTEDVRTFNRALSKDIGQIYTIRAFNVTNPEAQQIKSILGATKIWLYNGEKGEIYKEEYFYGVMLIDGSFVIQNTRRGLVNITLQITRERNSR